MAVYSREKGYDLFEDDDDSISEGDNGTSSEDEIDIILHGTPEQRRKLQHLQKKHQQGTASRLGQADGPPKADSSSEDEFEKEMNAELSQHVKFLEDTRGKLAIENKIPPAPSGSGRVSQAKTKTPGKKSDGDSRQDEFYDEIYFDSDEEDDPETSSKKKHAVISNDDLLYDPNMDDEDQKWVDHQRQSHRVQTGKKSKMPNSDALLDCPACMTTICIDCQRHETYKHQYRAMFVMNCVVDTSETLQCPEQASKKKKKNVPQPGQTVGSGDAAASDKFNPVRCTECNTVVGVIDHDEVYHFFNVLASYT